MKKIILVSVLLLVTFSGNAMSRTDNAMTRTDGFGLGVIAGEPTGISFKFWLSGGNAIDGAVAWSLGKNYTFHIHADYLMHKFDLIQVGKGSLPLYYGIGGRIKIWDDDRNDNNDDAIIGIRFPVGLDYIFEGAPFDLFMEIVPVLDLTPDTDLDFNGAIGFRYWF